MHDNPFESPAEESAVAPAGLASAGSLILEAFALMRRVPAIFAGIFIGHLALNFVSRQLVADDPLAYFNAAHLAQFVLSIAGYAVLLALGLVALEPPPRAVPLRAMMERVPFGAAISIAYVIIIYVGSLLLFVPGILFGVRYLFCVPLVLEGRVRATQALSLSEDLVRGRWWGIFGRGIVSVVPSILVSSAVIATGNAIELSMSPAVQAVTSVALVWQLAYYVVLYRSARDSA